MSAVDELRESGIAAENGHKFGSGKYGECYLLVTQLIAEAGKAKAQLQRGESPYASLSYCASLATNARKAWHIANEKE